MRHVPALLLALLLPAAAGAQGGTVSPGMSRAKVVAALGEPVTARTAGDHTYLFYHNECGRACGMNDLVVLQRDSVVDVIFRSPSRRYTGTSSSPAPLSRAAAERARPSAPARTDTPARMAPTPASDRRPAVPAGEPPVRPSPTPATRPPAP